ncbi:hypothetical protein DPMN_058822 [Dreissena polymorpha]|uniref:IRF tryptophan pentad repeat domain-containing protein n=1 Tax=Dreissena polymorpha TaxID=45954 RepID=A0A9D4HE64_DREPO|nr:hypothetical protein DPMN_058822 [Dreissena polymorpha]
MDAEILPVKTTAACQTPILSSGLNVQESSNAKSSHRANISEKRKPHIRAWIKAKLDSRRYQPNVSDNVKADKENLT